MELLNRRRFLRASGVSLALPLLERMGTAQGHPPEGGPHRMVAICTNLGILEKNFLPSGLYLQTMAEHEGRWTVFSGVSHPEVGGGHSAEDSFLTAAPHPGTASFRNSISLDQYAAERMGLETRFPSLALCVSQKGNPSLSWTSSGVMLPAERKPSEVFKSLFVSGDAAAVDRQVEELRIGRSVLDSVRNRAASLKRQLGRVDQERLDQYAEAVREVEKRLLAAEEWERKPKPKVDVPPPADGEYLLEKVEAMTQLIALALATDSTRVVTLMIRLDGFGAHVPGVQDEAHNLSHHVGREDKIAQLAQLESAQFRALSAFLKRLRENGVLDRTMVLYGSNLGNGNNHDNRNLPVLLAGGAFRHVGHLAFDRQKNTPLANLYVSMLRRLGLEVDRFASSTGPMKGLDLL